ncbi:hypothetical protein [Nocardia camponoti]|uniref:Uncharacterized protein n=1 Tax=Nocardia camponoti TaxID=1616106 RepID=A0A917QG83_9NOCA|nr:hypothetical protein [Nocardia camponoti]GGK48388.1 hypothetical protein GCM10011591_19730 [Nocardia camponoti]
MTRLIRVPSVAPYPRPDERPSAYRVALDSGQRIGVVVAERDDHDGVLTARRWFASWRLPGDEQARWITTVGHSTRRAAVAELLDVIANAIGQPQPPT